MAAWQGEKKPFWAQRRTKFDEIIVYNDFRGKSVEAATNKQHLKDNLTSLHCCE